MAQENDKQTILHNLFFNKGFLEQSNSKWLKYLIILILVGVFFMLVSNSIGNKRNTEISNSVNSNNKQRSESNYSIEDGLEAKLEQTLSQIAGVGEVKVNITLDTGPEYIYARDDENSEKEIVEQDKSGGTRKTEQYDQRSKIVVLNQGGESKAVIKKNIKAKIRGVLVVAEGASNSYIKADLIDAVKVGLGIDSYKIKVLAKER